uniref:Uncharacterized protein n=1 Tax=Siphoviridae sp. ct3pR10 TaxID=2826284 RepID=A0A8S5LWZ9_9CAUD|nr:MAG TPA: hypothetical protein [Siphoviridae sp. ct3pR10]
MCTSRKNLITTNQTKSPGTVNQTVPGQPEQNNK